MSNRILLLFIIFFFSLQGNAQKVGKVLRANTGSPIMGVNIYLSENRGVAVTDTLGQFEIGQLLHFAKNDTVFFSCVGHAKKAIALGTLREQHYTVYLQETAIPIGEVAVIGKTLHNFLPYKRLAVMPNNGISSFASLMTDSGIFVTGGDYTSIKMGALPTSPEQLRKMHNLIIEGYSKSAYQYDIDEDRWSKLKLNFEPRVGHTALNYRKRVYILGG